MILTKDTWTKENYFEFINYLMSLQDLQYQTFQSKLIPGNNSVIGVRVPVLFDIAKQISRGNYRDFFMYATNDYYEETIIWGFVIGLIKQYDEEFLGYIDTFLKQIDNWANCDLFCSHLKLIKRHREEFWNVILLYLNQDNPWVRRFCLVMILSYYVDSNYLGQIFDICNTYQMDHYYVKMAIAWLISICYVKYPQETFVYLKKNELDTWTRNKAISKICDSYRVSKEEKEILKKLKQLP